MVRGCQIDQLGSAAAMGEGVWKKCEPNLSAAAQKKIERGLAKPSKTILPGRHLFAKL